MRGVGEGATPPSARDDAQVSPLEGYNQSSRPFLNVDWATVCWKWSGRGRRDGYRVTVRTPFEKFLPMAYWRPDKCRVHVYATASIEEMGGSKLVLRARVQSDPVNHSARSGVVPYPSRTALTRHPGSCEEGVTGSVGGSPPTGSRT